MTLLRVFLKQGREELCMRCCALVYHVIETLHHWHLFLSDLLVGLESYKSPGSLRSHQLSAFLFVFSFV